MVGSVTHSGTIIAAGSGSGSILLGESGWLGSGFGALDCSMRLVKEVKRAMCTMTRSNTKYSLILNPIQNTLKNCRETQPDKHERDGTRSEGKFRA